MRSFLSNYISGITRGVWGLLAVMSLVSVAGLVGRATHLFQLEPWLGVCGAGVWHGRFWTLFTHPLLAQGWMELILCVVMLASIAPALERCWSTLEFEFFCLVVAGCAGLVKAVLPPWGGLIMIGPMPLSLGILAAWMRVCGSGSVSLFGVGQMSGANAGMLAGGASLLLTLFGGGGWINVLVLLGAVGAGWCYGLLRHAIPPRAAAGAPAVEERIARLEL